MKKYSKSYLKKWTKDELIAEILCLQHNLEVNEWSTKHLTNVLIVARKNQVVSDVIDSILGVWNESGGVRYE